MRRLGDAAHLLGIKPWEWDLLTVEQEENLLGWIDSYEEQMAEAEAEARGS